MGLGMANRMGRTAHPIGVHLGGVFPLIDQAHLDAIFTQGHGDGGHQGSERHIKLHRQPPDGVQRWVAVALFKAAQVGFGDARLDCARCA